MSKNENEKWDALDSDNRLADQINGMLKLESKGNIALLIVCIIDFLLLVFFQYLLEVIIFKMESFNLIWAIIFAAIVTLITGIISFRKRNK